MKKKSEFDKYDTKAIFDILRRKDFFTLFPIILIILSLLVWFGIVTRLGYNIVLKNHGLESAEFYSNIVTKPADYAIFTIMLVIFANMTWKNLFKITTLVAWVNLFLYIVDPSKIFRWIDYNKIHDGNQIK